MLCLNLSKHVKTADGGTKGVEIIFAITDTKLYVPMVTLPTQDNAKLLEQLKTGFKRTINQNKYEPKVSVQAPNPHLDFSVNPSFQGLNRLFVLSFENKEDRTVHAKYYLPLVKKNKGL